VPNYGPVFSTRVQVQSGKSHQKQDGMEEIPIKGHFLPKNFYRIPGMKHTNFTVLRENQRTYSRIPGKMQSKNTVSTKNSRFPGIFEKPAPESGNVFLSIDSIFTFSFPP
jgi:hypothetical protein